MLSTFEISPRTGQVTHLTHTETGSRITIECYESKLAFLIRYDRKTKINLGDWIKFNGTVRIDTSFNRRTGELNETNLIYWHEPNDGSRRFDWMFLELRTYDFKEIPPLNVMLAAKTLIEISEKLLESTPDILNKEILNKDFSEFKNSSETLLKYLNQFNRSNESVFSADPLSELT